MLRIMVFYNYEKQHFLVKLIVMLRGWLKENMSFECVCYSSFWVPTGLCSLSD